MTTVRRSGANKCPNCGEGIYPNAHAIRSLSQHRRFFGMIAAAFHHWPDGHEFQPSSSEHLRAWLLCKAGYRDVVTVPVESDRPAVIKLAMLAVEGALRAARTHAFVRLHGSSLVVFTAKSISFHALPHGEFQSVNDAVQEIIEVETGTAVDKLLTEKAA